MRAIGTFFNLHKQLIFIISVVVSGVALIVAIVLTTTQPTFTPSQANNQRAQASMSLISINSEDSNGTKTLYLMVNTAGEQISGIDAKLEYDPRLMTVAKVDRSADSPFSSYPALNVDATNGLIYIAANIGANSTATPVSGSQIRVAEITVTNITDPKAARLDFVFTPGARNDSNIVPFISSGQEISDILGAVTNYNGTNQQNPTATTNTVNNQNTIAVKSNQNIFQRISSFFKQIFR